MSLDRALGWFTIAAGARELNENLPMVGTPITNFFDEAQNEFIRTGHKVAGNILYKREITQNVTSGYTRAREDIIDPYQHFEMPWRQSQAVYNEDGNTIEDNLGGVTIQELMRNSNMMARVPQGDRNTLVNILAPRFRNLNTSYREKKETDFLKKSVDEEGNEGPDGIDVITNPNTSYGGLGYTECGVATWKSDLLGVNPYLWNPLTKDKGAVSITKDDYRAAARDIQKQYSNLTNIDNSKPWTYFWVSPNRYDNGVLKEWYTERRRTTPEDTEMGPTREFQDSVLRIRFKSVPMIENDNIVYFFAQGAILRAMQRRRTPAQSLMVEKAYGQNLVKFTMRQKYQYRSDARWQTGWIKGPI